MRSRVGLAFGVVTAAWLGCAGSALAAGYGIYEQGAAVLGMAGAGAAGVSDASAIFYNPAALTRLEPRQQLYLGGSFLTPVTSFAGVDPYPGFGVTEKMKTQFFELPASYYARPIGEKGAVGLGVFTPYGLGVDWDHPDLFTGRYIVTKAKLIDITASLTGAYAIGPKVSVGLGADLAFAKVSLENRILAPIPGGGGQQVDVADAKLDADHKTGPGWNVGLLLTPVERWRFGATYRGKIVAKPSGDATFRQIPTGDPTFDAAVAASLPPDQKVHTVLRFPAIWSAGAAWMPGRWTLAADAVFTEWSVFTDLPIDLQTTPAASQDRIEDYGDTWAFRAGAEHRLPAFTYRFGYYFEQEAAPSASVSPLLPDAARHGVTLGFGKSWGQWQLDLYNLFLFAERRGTEGVDRDGFNGEYKTYVNSIGFNLGYHWGPSGEIR
jgi:long-chain fatty acid transport protein